MAELIILEPAQHDLETIAMLHLQLVGRNSSQKIVELILDTLSRLRQFPLSGQSLKDRQLRSMGYRFLVAGKYICIYRQIGDSVYVYRIVHGATDYPNLFRQFFNEA